MPNQEIPKVDDYVTCQKCGSFEQVTKVEKAPNGWTVTVRKHEDNQGVTCDESFFITNLQAKTLQAQS